MPSGGFCPRPTAPAANTAAAARSRRPSSLRTGWASGGQRRPPGCSAATPSPRPHPTLAPLSPPPLGTGCYTEAA
eukprot:130117-Alexandrium_andersonii.AAC.1